MYDRGWRGTITSAAIDDDVLHCARHPDVETYLRCQTCETPICPKCLVQTPVGAKCPDCARLRPPVQYQVPLNLLLRAASFGLSAAVGVGILWGLLFPPRFNVLSLFGLFAGAAAGWAIGEAISRGANRRRGRTLMALAVVCVVVAYFARNIVAGDALPDRDTTGWIVAAIAAFMAASNLR